MENYQAWPTVSAENRYLPSVPQRASQGTSGSAYYTASSPEPSVIRPATVDEAVAYIQKQRLDAHWASAKNWLVWFPTIIGSFAFLLGGVWPSDPSVETLQFTLSSALVAAIITTLICLVLVFLGAAISTPGPRLSDRLWARAILAYYRGDMDTYETLRQEAEDHDAAARAFIAGLLILTMDRR